MKIFNHVATLPSAHSEPTASLGNTVSHSDAALFSSELESTEAVPAVHGVNNKPEALFDKTSTLFQQMDADKKHLNKVLRKASHSTDPLVLNQVDSTLSNYYLQSLMNAKVVSKSVQGLEKLTNLQ